MGFFKRLWARATKPPVSTSSASGVSASITKKAPSSLRPDSEARTFQLGLPADISQLIDALEEERPRLNKSVKTYHSAAQTEISPIVAALLASTDTAAQSATANGFPGQSLSRNLVRQAQRLGLPLDSLSRYLALSPFFVSHDTKWPLHQKIVNNLTIYLNSLLATRPPGVAVDDPLPQILRTCLSTACIKQEVDRLVENLRVRAGGDAWQRLSLTTRIVNPNLNFFCLEGDGYSKVLHIADATEYGYALGHLHDGAAIPLLRRARKCFPGESRRGEFPFLVALCKLDCAEEHQELLRYLKSDDETPGVKNDLVYCIRLGLLYDQEVAAELERLIQQTQDRYLHAQITDFLSDRRCYLAEDSR